MNFEGDPEASRIVINKWISEITKEKIKDLLAKGTITNMTRFVLANAVYFKGSWKDKFEKTFTNTDGVFHTLSNKEVKVSMMYKEEKFSLAYFEDLDVQALKIPFEW